VSFLVKILGDPNDREVARHLNRVEEINALEPEMEARSDDALRAFTDELRARVREARGEAVAASGDEKSISCHAPGPGAPGATKSE